MALTNFQEHFDNTYQEVFQKTLVAKPIMNTRFESKLSYGESVERFAYDISGVRVRTVTRGQASTVDAVTDSTELLTINLEKEAVFHISDGEMTQAGPLNPGSVIGGQIGLKVAIDLDARCFAETLNASFDFDNGDLTTLASTGTPISLTSTTVPQMTSRMAAKLRRRNNIDTSANMAFVVDSYAASDIAQYLMSKNIDLAGYVFKNGFSGPIDNAELYVSENLTGEVLLTGSGVFSNTETIVINGITFTAVSSIGSTAGNFLIGANLAASLTNLAGLINAPGTTSATQVALSSADQEVVSNWAATATATTISIVMTGSGRPIVSETGANLAVTKAFFHAYFGKKGAIDLVIQDMKKVDMRPTSDRRGVNVFSSYLAGIKTFADGAKKFLDVHIAA
jgi:hypothetical protein